MTEKSKYYYRRNHKKYNIEKHKKYIIDNIKYYMQAGGEIKHFKALLNRLDATT